MLEKWGAVMCTYVGDHAFFRGDLSFALEQSQNCTRAIGPHYFTFVIMWIHCLLSFAKSSWHGRGGESGSDKGPIKAAIWHLLHVKDYIGKISRNADQRQKCEWKRYLELLKNHVDEHLDSWTGLVAEHVEDGGSDVSNVYLVTCALTQDLSEHGHGNFL